MRLTSGHRCAQAMQVATWEESGDAYESYASHRNADPGGTLNALRAVYTVALSAGEGEGSGWRTAGTLERMTTKGSTSVSLPVASDETGLGLLKGALLI